LRPTRHAPWLFSTSNKYAFRPSSACL